MNAIGYACQLVGPPRVALRHCVLRGATPEKIAAAAAHNLAALDRMIAYNAARGIRLFRISSDIIPLATHPDARFDWHGMFAEEMTGNGARIAETGQRVSMHPGQYTVLNSPDDGVAERANGDLAYHAAFLDALGVPGDGKIVLHVGGVYGDRKGALRRFRERFSALPDSVRDRVVIENDERSFAIDEVCDLAGELGVPAVMDVFHHRLLPPAKGDEMFWLRCSGETWKRRDGRQKIHYSEQLPGGKAGRHSRTIDAAAFAAFYRSVESLPLDVMLEVKDKNLSAVKCRNCVTESLPRARLTEAWAEYKYAVLEHSPAHYERIRRFLKARTPDPIGFYTLVDEALAGDVGVGHAVNAAQHVWGYFRKLADAAEKRRAERLLAGLGDAVVSADAVKRFLLRLAHKYERGYLTQSLYFDI